MPRLKIAKVDEEKRLVTAIASVVSDSDGTPIVDHQGDVISIDDLELAFIKSFATGGRAKGGEMHTHIGGAHVVQQFTLSADERESLGFGKGPEIGIVKMFVDDDDLWARTKSGDLPEMSIAGTAKRTPIHA